MVKSNQQLIFLFMMVILFAIAPFFTSDNAGGIGLALTFNIPVWVIATWMMTMGFLMALFQNRLVIPKAWPYIVIFPVVALLGTLISNITQPDSWFFRQLYILGGLGFIFALFQFNATNKTIEQLLLYISYGIGLHAAAGLIQVHAPMLLPSFLPVSELYPRGIFQQINVQASLMATGIAIQLYLLLRPSFRQLGFFHRALYLIAFAAMVCVILISESRVGLLGGLIVIVVMSVTYFEKLLRQWPIVLAMLIITVPAVYLNQENLNTAADKTSNISAGHTASARLIIYKIAIETIKEEPIFGHGLGQFRSVWNEGASDYVKRYPETLETLKMAGSLNHAHNEFMMWFIEAGLASVLALLIFAVGVLIFLIKCGLQRGIAYSMMLLPISLHTQVELPFYISAVHWFLWLFLLYLVFRHDCVKKEFMSSTATTAHKMVFSIIPVIAASYITFFMINTAKAQADLYTYIYEPDENVHGLRLALDNSYFNGRAERIAMRNMLYVSLKNADREKIELFESWAQDYVKRDPRLKVYLDLIKASQFLRPELNGCDLIEKAYEMYAYNKGVRKQHALCSE